MDGFAIKFFSLVMVIDNLHIVRIGVLPAKAQAVLIVDPDRVLADPSFVRASSEFPFPASCPRFSAASRMVSLRSETRSKPDESANP